MSIMKWMRAIRETPLDKQEVLVANGDEFFIAKYSASDKKFYCKNGTIFGISENVKWAELLPPDND
jgi:hypothetical protein